jgi:hypothetical protein
VIQFSWFNTFQIKDILFTVDLQLPMQWVPITNNGVSSNPDVTLCDRVCRRLVTGRWFSPGSPVSSFKTCIESLSLATNIFLMKTGHYMKIK